ncbi:MAG TPA: MFS transporter [Firmicutes bacterium]|nr:MFS transporter [Bacillota bacterium]
MVNTTEPARRTRIHEFLTQIQPGMRRLIAIGMVEVMAVGLYVSLLAPWYKSLGYESVAQGWLNSIVEITGAVVAVAGGVLADKYGRKNMYTAGQLMRCAAIILLLSTGSLAGLVAVSVVRGLSVIQFPARTAFIAGHTAKETRATTLGIYQTASLVANIVAPLAAGLMADRFGVKPPLLLALGLGVLAIIMAIPIGRSEDSPHSNRNTAQAVNKASQTPGSGKLSLETLLAAGREMFEQSNRRLLVPLLIAFTANGLTNGGVNILLPFTIMDRFSTEYKAVTALSVVSSLGTALVMLIGGRIADVRGRRGIIVTTGLIMPVLLFSVFWITELWQVYALLMLGSMITNLAGPALMAAKMEAVDEEYRATWDGLVTGGSSLGSAMGYLVWGIMYQASYTWSWLAVIFLCFIQVFCYHLALRPE